MIRLINYWNTRSEDKISFHTDPCTHTCTVHRLQMVDLPKTDADSRYALNTNIDSTDTNIGLRSFTDTDTDIGLKNYTDTDKDTITGYRYRY